LYTSATVQNAEITHSRPTLIFTDVTLNHGDSRKSRHTTKITLKPQCWWIRDHLTTLINVTISGHYFAAFARIWLWTNLSRSDSSYWLYPWFWT